MVGKQFDRLEEEIGMSKTRWQWEPKPEREKQPVYKGSSGDIYGVVGVSSPRKGQRGLLKRPQTRDKSRGEIEGQSRDIVYEARVLASMTKRLKTLDRIQLSHVRSKVPELLDEGEHRLGNYFYQFIVTEEIQAKTLKEMRQDGELTAAVVLCALDGYARLIDLAHLDIANIPETTPVPNYDSNLPGEAKVFIYKGFEFTAEEAQPLVYNDAQPSHIFWQDTPPAVIVIDWGNARFLQNGRAAGGRLSVNTDWEQFSELAASLLAGFPAEQIVFGEAIAGLQKLIVGNAITSLPEFRLQLEKSARQVEEKIQEKHIQLEKILTSQDPKRESELREAFGNLIQLVGKHEAAQSRVRAWRGTMLLKSAQQHDLDSFKNLFESIRKDLPPIVELLVRAIEEARANGRPEEMKACFDAVALTISGKKQQALNPLNAVHSPSDSLKVARRGLVKEIGTETGSEIDKPLKPAVIDLYCALRGITEQSHGEDYRDAAQKSAAQLMEILEHWTKIPDIGKRREIYKSLAEAVGEARVSSLEKEKASDVGRLIESAQKCLKEALDAWEKQKFDIASGKFTLLETQDSERKYFCNALAGIEAAQQSLPYIIKFLKQKERPVEQAYEWLTTLVNIRYQVECADWLKALKDQLEQLAEIPSDFSTGVVGASHTVGDKSATMGQARVTPSSDEQEAIKEFDEALQNGLYPAADVYIGQVSGMFRTQRQHLIKDFEKFQDGDWGEYTINSLHAYMRELDNLSSLDTHILMFQQLITWRDTLEKEEFPIAAEIARGDLFSQYTVGRTIRDRTNQAMAMLPALVTLQSDEKDSFEKTLDSWPIDIRDKLREIYVALENARAGWQADNWEIQGNRCAILSSIKTVHKCWEDLQAMLPKSKSEEYGWAPTAIAKSAQFKGLEIWMNEINKGADNLIAAFEPLAERKKNQLWLFQQSGWDNFFIAVAILLIVVSVFFACVSWIIPVFIPIALFMFIFGGLIFWFVWQHVRHQSLIQNLNKINALLESINCVEASLFEGHRQPYTRNNERLTEWQEIIKNNSNSRVALQEGIQILVNDDPKHPLARWIREYLREAQKVQKSAIVLTLLGLSFIVLFFLSHKTGFSLIPPWQVGTNIIPFLAATHIITTVESPVFAASPFPMVVSSQIAMPESPFVYSSPTPLLLANQSSSPLLSEPLQSLRERCAKIQSGVSSETFQLYKTLEADVLNGKVSGDDLASACGAELVALHAPFEALPVEVVSFLHRDYFPKDTRPVYYTFSNKDGRAFYHLFVSKNLTSTLTLLEDLTPASANFFDQTQASADIAWYEVMFGPLVDTPVRPGIGYGVVFSITSDETWQLLAQVNQNLQTEFILEQLDSQTIVIQSEKLIFPDIIALTIQDALTFRVEYHSSGVTLWVNTTELRPALTLETAPQRLRLGLSGRGDGSHFVHVILDAINLGIRR